MDYIVKNNEPLALVNSMNSYFKQIPPDCSLFSQYNCEIQVHREILYQTSYLRDMIKSVNMDYSCCKIGVIIIGLWSTYHFRLDKKSNCMFEIFNYKVENGMNNFDIYLVTNMHIWPKYYYFIKYIFWIGQSW